LLDPAHAVADQGLDFLGSLGAALGQAAHFGGHHGKAATVFTRSGGLDRGIQGQDIGLEGDAVNDADDVGYLA